MTPFDHQAELHAFGEVMTCPKCAGGPDGNGLRRTWCSGEEHEGDRLCRDVAHEHLHVRCESCRFQWLERCMDDDG